MSPTDLVPTASEPSPPAEFLRQVANASACFPLCFLLVFYGQWGLSWAVLGYEPRVNLDDPKGVDWVRWLHPFTGCMLIALLPVSAVALVSNLAYVLRSGRGRGLARLLVVAAIVATPLLLQAMDPGGVFQWWID